MAAFNTISGLIITAETTVVPDEGRAIRHAEGGEIRGRNAYSETVYIINVVAKGTVAVKQALKTFYNTNKNIMNEITIDDTDYSAMFSSEPAVTSKDGDIRWLNFGLLGFDFTGQVTILATGLGATGSVGAVTVTTS